MALPIIVTCLAALFFFMAGCLNMGIYIAQTPSHPFEPFIAGMLTNAWPLAVACALFMLLDIRLHQSVSSRRADEPELPEAAAPRLTTPATRAEAAPVKRVSYFSSTGDSLPPEPEEEKPQDRLTARTTRLTVELPFNTSPFSPAEEVATPPKSDQKTDGQDAEKDLSFFKL